MSQSNSRGAGEGESLQVTPATLGIPSRVAVHVLSLVLIASTNTAVGFTLPIVAKKVFDASKWQVLLMTAAPAVLLALSIFWGDQLKRTRLIPYLLTYWGFALVPLGVIGLSQPFWLVIAVFLVHCIGQAAWPVVNGEILKAMYPDSVRGRLYGLIITCTTIGAAGMAYGLFAWLERNPQAFRTFMPVASVVQLAGIGILCWLLWKSGVLAGRKPVTERASFSQRVFEPLTHTSAVLRNDKMFARYEAAFMTYGAAWMICEALKPNLLTDKLGLSFEEIGRSAFFTFQIAVAACTFLAGSLMDRLGAARLCVLAFGLYTLYPIGLATAAGADDIMLATVVYGICTAGVNAGWMLGPVSLAPSPDKVPQYVAIHATMVGLRGTVFQFLGIAMLQVTGSYSWSLGLAAILFAWASWQMWRLHVVRTRAMAHELSSR